MFNQIVDVSPDCGGASDGVKPAAQASQAGETFAQTAVPKFPLGTLELADRVIAQVVAHVPVSPPPLRHQARASLLRRRNAVG
jgi:predicted dienelactone hydrolase